jgi:hypothetical protein
VKTSTGLCVVGLLWAGADAFASDSVRSRDWQPLAASEAMLPVMPVPFWVEPDERMGADSSLWVQIDPVTGAIVPRTLPVALRPAPPAQPLPRMELRSTPEGYLYLDTRGYQNYVTAHLGPDGSLHLDCSTPSHGASQPDGTAPSPESLPEDRQ